MYSRLKIHTFKQLDILLSFSFILLLHLTASAQLNDEYCGTTIDEANYDHLIELNQRWEDRAIRSDLSKAYGGTTFFVPVQMHLIRQDSGLGGSTEAEALAALDRMNEYYIDASIHFYLCDDINFIDNSNYYDYHKDQMNELDAAYSQDNVVNIYVANTATNSSGSGICGHAQFPGGLDFIMVTTSCMNNGSTLAHEMGHYLGLYHTHTTSFGSEAVNGSDCATQGDLICDTPADPNLSGEVNNDGCIYEGTDTDENGEFYTPQVTNLMSYAAKECRFVITEGQLDKALWTLQNERAYLSCSPPELEANFYIHQDESCDNGKLITFYNASEGAVTSYSWDFGDGVGTSTSESPDWIYWANGVYNVTLTVSDGVNSHSYSQKIAVGPVSIPYTNDFEVGTDDLSDFTTSSSMKNEVSVHPDAAESGAFGMLLDGNSENGASPYFQAPSTSEAFGELWNPYFKSSATLCVDASYITDLQLEFDKRQIRTTSDSYTNLVVTVNGQQEGSVIRVNSAGADDLTFTHLVYDLSAYNNQIITIGFEGTHRYDKDRNGTDNGTATFIDNISITGVLSSDDLAPTELISIYPNPSSSSIYVSTMEKDYIILDVLGKVVTDLTMVRSHQGNTLELDISQLENGVYHFKTTLGIQRFIKTAQ